MSQQINMFNLKLYSQLSTGMQLDFNKVLFCKYEITEVQSANKKRVCSIAWNSTGTKFISGS